MTFLDHFILFYNIMKTKPIWCLLIIVITNPGKLIGQEQKHEHHHHEHSYEIGISLGLVHLKQDGINAPSTHVHLFKRLGSENYLKRVAFGLGVEYIFTEHIHLGFLGTISYNPVGALIIDISPGLLISEHDNEKETQFISHMELTYEFDPVVGVAFSEDDEHYTFGIHFGKGL